MKKRLWIVIVCAVVISLCGCGKGEGTAKVSDLQEVSKDESKRNASNNETVSEVSLQEHGMDVVSIMAEMANKGLSNDWYDDRMIYSSYLDKINACDYSNPVAVYQLTLPSDLSEILMQAKKISQEDINQITTPLMNHFAQSYAYTYYTMMIMNFEVIEKRFSCAYMAETLFTCSEPNENQVYLYAFDGGYPIAVFFKVGEDHAVSAKGTFLLTDNFTPGSEEEVQKQLNDMVTASGIFTVKMLSDH